VALLVHLTISSFSAQALLNAKTSKLVSAGTLNVSDGEPVAVAWPTV
jgi:hypothetical protein